MVKKKKRVKKPIPTYACDFETNTEAWLSDKGWQQHVNGDQAFVWCWGGTEVRENMSFTGELDNFLYGKSMKDFMDWMLNGSKNVWFHNLKFDGSFIAVALLRLGYKFTFDRNPAVGEFTGLIDGKKMWFSLTVCKEGPRGGRQFINIKDSLKKVPFGLRKCAMAFGLDVFKDDMDYDVIRGPFEPITEADYKYLKKDVEITAKIIHYQVFQSGLNKTTIGSDALNEFKTTVGGDKGFKDIFPVLDYETDSFIRKSYFGGVTQVKPGREGELIGEGCVFDINSMYPYVQYYKLLPYGTPIPYDGDYEDQDQDMKDEYPLYIQKISFSFKVKDNMLPTIQLKKQNVEFNHQDYDDVRKFNGREFQKSSFGEIVTMYLTNVQLEQVLRHYDIDNEIYHEGYMFKGKEGIFKEHIDKWIQVKIQASKDGNGALKELSKLMLNSPYGKFGTNTIRLNVEPFLWEDDGSLGFKVEDEDPPPADPIYTAYASFVTAYAREELVSTIMLCYDRFVYCDTDSIHLEGVETPKEILHKIDPDALGMWDKEGEFKYAKFHRAKTYCEMLFAKKVKKKDRWGDMVDTIKHISKEEWTSLEEEERTLDKNLKCAGMQRHIADTVTFEEFEIGLKIDPYNPAKPKWKGVGKLMPSQVSGGTLLKIRKFSLN
ncbi:DNA polymerase [Bacillus phage DLc1]|uniref:DNA-directed DNA polymerase n=1 Tax=Bacillus phage DLc1 TaxID=2777318 RepID=A0A7M1RPU2_9CAUD|nr:DNA polymerase [Bacillus phage DLc1]QOR56266.1 DNA polymerase [Bacillus phage DLc1]